ncbi:unnamed protein product, partial [marine sediment metagenome]
EKNGVLSCDFKELSGRGIHLSGGDRKTLTPSNHFAKNNHIYNFSRIHKTYHPAINVDGVGQNISHNYIHDAPHTGLTFAGNEHVFSYNEICRVALETGDVGAIGIAMDWSYCGNLLEYNYIHNVHGSGRYVPAKGIYQDLPVGGSTVYGNIFYDLDEGFMTNSGRYNVIVNNVFVKCTPSIFLNVYRAPSHFVLGGPWKLVERLDRINYRKPPYAKEYPWLPRVLAKNDDPPIPYGNIIVNNISYDGRFLHLHQQVDFNEILVEKNIIADTEVLDWRKVDQEQVV